MSAMRSGLGGVTRSCLTCVPRGNTGETTLCLFFFLFQGVIVVVAVVEQQ